MKRLLLDMAAWFQGVICRETKVHYMIDRASQPSSKGPPPYCFSC
jgi:hypothetical protein